MIETNKIKEIHQGHFQVILDFPLKEDILKIIDHSYAYIWGVNHIENALEWEMYHHSIFENPIGESKVMVRNITMEYLISTRNFIDIVPKINRSILIIQTNIEPPPYLDLNRLKGKGRYDLLKSKVDYLFELDMPSSADYAPIVSPNMPFLESIITKFT